MVQFSEKVANFFQFFLLISNLFSILFKFFRPVSSSSFSNENAFGDEHDDEAKNDCIDEHRNKPASLL